MIQPFSHLPSSPLVFGVGAVASLGTQGGLRRAVRVLAITDRGVKRAGISDRAFSSLASRIALLDEDTQPDADCAHVDQLGDKARQLNVDAIVAVGGGSVIDTAKGVAAVIAKQQPIATLEGVATIRAQTLPLIVVPTTAGTGSEATQFAVLRDRVAGKKRIYVDTALIPSLALLDPELVVTTPRTVTAATGVDAIAHAVEALFSKGSHPLGAMLAVEALRLLVVDGALARSLDDGKDVDARSRCLLAANLAGQAVSSCYLGACHALAHALGAMTGVAHGVANGIFLAEVMRLNAMSSDGAMQRLRSVLGNEPIDVVRRVVHELAQVPTRLRDVGVRADQLAELARLAEKDPDLTTNPTTLDVKALMGIVERLW